MWYILIFLIYFKLIETNHSINTIKKKQFRENRPNFLIIDKVNEYTEKKDSLLLDIIDSFHLKKIELLYNDSLTDINNNNNDYSNIINNIKDYDILWSYDPIIIENLPINFKHQKINKIPGSIHLFDKYKLNELIKVLKKNFSNNDFNYFRSTYFLLKDKNEFIKEYNGILKRPAYDIKSRKNPSYNKKWIYIKKLKNKNETNNNMNSNNDNNSNKEYEYFNDYIKSEKEITKNENLNLTIYNVLTRFIEPFLIDGYKFNFELFVTITSLDPLRVYIYDDTILKFSTQKYNPFILKNNNILDGYLVNEDSYLPPWDIPELFDEYYTEIPSKYRPGRNHLYMLYEYVSTKGLNIFTLKHKIEKNIINILTGTRHLFLNELEKVNGLKVDDNFFGLFRFTMTLDDGGTPYILKIKDASDVSPKDFPKSAGTDYALKYNILRDLINLVLGSKFDKHTLEKYPNDFFCERYCNDNNYNKLTNIGCWKCPGNLNSQDVDILYKTVQEYSRKGSFRLLYPYTIRNTKVDFKKHFFNEGETDLDLLIQRYFYAIFDQSSHKNYNLIDDNIIRCVTREECSNNGDCVNGKCFCDRNYEGNSCYIPNIPKHLENENIEDTHMLLKNQLGENINNDEANSQSQKYKDDGGGPGYNDEDNKIKLFISIIQDSSEAKTFLFLIFLGIICILYYQIKSKKFKYKKADKYEN